MKKLLITVCMAVTSMAVLAQSGTNSPYSSMALACSESSREDSIVE